MRCSMTYHGPKKIQHYEDGIDHGEQSAACGLCVCAFLHLWGAFFVPVFVRAHVCMCVVVVRLVWLMVWFLVNHSHGHARVHATWICGWMQNVRSVRRSLPTTIGYMYEDGSPGGGRVV